MHDSVRALMEGILDYAGLFPPARLDMPEAVRNYARYREGSHAWMLARFVCPASRLEELRSLANLSPGNPWKLSVLGGRHHGMPAFLTGLAEEMDAAAAFVKACGGGAVTDVLETLFPPALLSASPDEQAAFLDEVAARLESRATLPRTVFFELGFPEGWPEALRGAADAFAAHNRRHPAVRFGMKVRTGGVEASAIPAPHQVGGFLLIARDAGVPFKATAGLHHPLRHHDDSVETEMHGFLNVFLAGILMHHGKIENEELRDLLRDLDHDDFRFTAGGAAWRSHEVTPEEIRSGRKFAVSFGSCSFTEPWEDLHAMKLLDTGPEGVER